MSSPPQTVIATPEWINWAKTNDNGLPYYRKMTNLWGGATLTEPSLQWLSYFDPTRVNHAGVKYSENPKYVWFYDLNSAKLKVSDANDPKTYTLNPVSNPPCYEDKNGDKCTLNCCDANSTTLTDGCVYRYFKDSDIASANSTLIRCTHDSVEDGGNHWSGPYTTSCDHVSYITGFVPPSGYPDLDGTFCNNVSNEGAHMRTVLGCDCSSKHCQNF